MPLIYSLLMSTLFIIIHILPFMAHTSFTFRLGQSISILRTIYLHLCRRTGLRRTCLLGDQPMGTNRRPRLRALDTTVSVIRFIKVTPRTVQDDNLLLQHMEQCTVPPSQ